MAAGAAAFFQKPPDNAELLEVILPAEFKTVELAT